MRFFVLITLFTCVFTYGQSILKTNQFESFCFYNYNSNKFTVIHDSTGCYEYNVQKKNWEFKKLTFCLEEPFSVFLSEYIVLHEKNSKIFFVDRGCGYVYTLINDTIKRHDKSSHHNNQFFGTFFLQNGEPHIFGGYGLFTFKNIITYYNSNEREWFSYKINGPEPSIRYKSHGEKIGDRLYISGGTLDDNNLYNDLWSFDFNSIRWKFEGNLNPEITSAKDFFLHFYSAKSFIPCQNKIYNIDYPKNLIYIYDLKVEELLYKILVENDFVLLKKRQKDHKKFEYIVQKRSDFFHNKPKIIPLTIAPSNNVSEFNFLGYKTYIISFILLILLLFLYLRTKIKKANAMSFDSAEKELINLFCKNNINGIEIAEISDFVNSDNPSADTLKKRRENLIRNLRQKISKDCKISFEDVFIESKHPLDKRIKILILNPKAIDRYRNMFS